MREALSGTIIRQVGIASVSRATLAPAQLTTIKCPQTAKFLTNQFDLP